MGKRLHVLILLLLSSVTIWAAPVSEYKMDEAVWNGTPGEVIDSIGSNNGTAENGAAIDTTDSVSGNSGSFDGVDDYIALQNELATLRGTASLSFWVKTTQTGDDTSWRAPAIAGIEENGGADDIFWGTIDSTGHIGINVGDGSATLSTTAVNDNRWHHVVITRDSDTGELVVYIDGSEENRGTDTAGVIGNTFSSLGCRENTNGTWKFYQGLLDEVEIFDTVLTAEEVRDLYFKYHEIAKPIINYRADECFWFDNANGITGDVKDQSANAYDATSYNTAAVAPGILNNAGHFTSDGDYVETEDADAGNTDGKLSVTLWVKLEARLEQYEVILTKSTAWNWSDGWGFVHATRRSDDSLTFFIETNDEYYYIDTTLTTDDDWTFFAFTYDGNTLKLYKNDNLEGTLDASGLTIHSVDPFRLADDDGAGTGGDSTLQGYLDEVKVWDTGLSEAEVLQIYANESSGKNYDGEVREPVTCSATINGGTWELIGIPADLRNESDTSIARILGDDMAGTYGTEWRVYRRDYSDTNNSSWYTYLSDINTPLEFGVGYWLGSYNTESWNVNDLLEVDYNATSSACPAERCVEIPLKSVSLNAETESTLGTGPYRYYMTGFIGKSPVDWADCRILVDGVAYTPSDAEAAGYIAKQIWQYNPSSSDADGKGYTTCDDVTPGSCILPPYKGFWIELHGPTKGKSVKLLVPKE